MSLTGFVVLFFVLWFITLWVLLPIGLKTQGEAGDVVEGTPQSAPSNLQIKRKFIWATIITFMIWIPLITLITLSGVTVADINPQAWLAGREN